MVEYKFSKKSLENLNGVDERLQRVAIKALEYCPISFGISWGLRTKEQQKEMFDKGLSKCDGVKKISKHQLGLAIDVYAYVDGKADYSVYWMDVIHVSFIKASLELKIPITWGGSWTKFKDMPHYEIKESLV